MKKILSVIVAIGCGIITFKYSILEGFINPYPVMCDLVSSKIYLTDDVVKNWKQQCLKRSQLVDSTSSKKLVIRDMNNILATLKVSHLEVYDSKEVNSIWKGESLETGIESEFVDSELVIFKVHKDSPGSLSGLKFGDIIKQINHEQPSPWDAASLKGVYTIQRGIEVFELEISPQQIKRSEAISLRHLNKDTLVVRVPSFRAEFFDEVQMSEISQEVQKSRTVVLDLRGNLGGNFVAGLRLASLFVCEPQVLGYLTKPRAELETIEVLPNNLSDQAQIAVLESHSKVELKTFYNENCFKGALKILVDGKSASVSEMVAQSLKEVLKVPVLGAPTRGQMLVGMWYAFDELAPGVQISIPEAVFVSKNNYLIEGVGVQLDRSLFYDLHEMQAGVDSWVKSALD